MAAAPLRPDSPQTEPFPPLLQPPSTKAHSTAAGADKLGAPGRTTPLPLTGQAAMTDLKRRRQQQERESSRQTSPNPAVQAMQSLMGGGGISRPSDAPAPDKLSEPMRSAAEKIHIPNTAQGQGESSQVSPVSTGSFGSLEGSAAPSATTATATNGSGSQFVAEPAQMTEGGSYASDGNLAIAGEDPSKAFSYPGPPPQADQQDAEGGPSRGMSYPGLKGSPKSPASNKRHKCPYCSTDFTRHHNLKSHLLTHSQEKPYVCQTCQARFRRLHDLKRHTKLHTGERPHICDKCGRRFARGDALARHNKGPGGCAGRRSSFGADDDFDGANEGMDGMEYTGDGDDDETGDPQARRVSEPSRKRTQLETPQDLTRDVYRQHSSTYPPVQSRPHGSSVSSMGPPTVIHPGSSNATSPRELQGQPSPAQGGLGASYYPAPPYPGAQGQVFGQQAMMTESPKPLSPGQLPDQHRLSVDAAASQNRNRSPSLATQLQQQHFGRGSGRGTPPQSQAPGQLGSGPTLPPLPAGQPQARSGLTSMPGAGPSSLHHQQLPPTNVGGGQGSNRGSLSSHGRSSGSSLRDVMTGAGAQQHSTDGSAELWSYVRNLEARMGKMQEEYELRIRNLQDEVHSLRSQVNASQTASYSSDMLQQTRGGY